MDFTGSAAQYTQPLPGSFLFGAGAGTSTMFKQPSYQRGTVPAALSNRYGNRAARVVPDLVAVADPYTGFLLGETVDGTVQLGTIGGTSLACPVIVAMQATASSGRKPRSGSPIRCCVPCRPAPSATSS